MGEAKRKRERLGDAPTEAHLKRVVAKLGMMR